MCLHQNFLHFVVECILFLPRNKQDMSINMNGQIIHYYLIEGEDDTNSFHLMDIYPYNISTFTSHWNYGKLNELNYINFELY